MSEPTATSSLDDIIARAKDRSHVRVKTVRILIDQDLLERKDELEAEITAAVAADARENRTPVAIGLAREMEALDAKIEASKDTFKFRSVGQLEWYNLMGSHPPTKEQAAKTRGIDHDPSTFPYAAVALSWVDPDNENWVPDAKSDEHKQRVARFIELAGDINISQWQILWRACLDANLGGVDTPKSVAAGIILRANGRSVNSASLADAPSLAASSSDV